jgi:molybdopterin converting factor small subunit
MNVFYLNNFGGGFADNVRIEAETTIEQFVKEHVEGDAANYMIRVNRLPVEASYVLKEGDRISVTPTKIAGA